LVEAVAYILIGLVLIWIVPGLIDSNEQRKLHRDAVHPDRSAVKTTAIATVKTPTKLVYRDINGTLHRVLVDESETNSFVNDTLIYLDSERSKIKAETKQEIAALLETAFGDRQDAIDRYANWYFESGRSWVILKEAVVGGLRGLGVNNVQGFAEASRNEVEAYLVRNYEHFVLEPELRNPTIDAGISRILANAHVRYLATLTTIESRAQAFLSKFTQHLVPIDPLSTLSVSLDWDAQKWKAPRYAVEDEAFHAILRGTQFATVSALIAATVGPTIERAVAQVFLATAGRIVASAWPQILGAVAGSVLEPGAGTLAGWLAGVGGALALDYVFDRNRERVGRPDFERANAEALDTTIVELSRAIQRDLFRTIDAWFDDTGTIVVKHSIQKR
jgi:hypothetical protein